MDIIRKKFLGDFSYWLAGISAFMIVSDLTNDFNKYMDKIKEDPNPKHLNDYFKELSDDLVNLTINEIKDIPRDILLDEIQEK